MLDVDTFSTLYVMVDDFCHSQPQRSVPVQASSPGARSLPWLSLPLERFNSERDFYRYADTKLRDAFPTLPDRSQFNRSVRSTPTSSRLSSCIWWLWCRPQGVLTKLWTARRCHRDASAGT